MVTGFGRATRNVHSTSMRWWRRQTEVQVLLRFGFGWSLLFLLALLQTGVATLSEFVLEFLDASSAVHILKLASVERMALVTNVNLQLFLRTPCCKGIPTTAANCRFKILGMDVFLHDGTRGWIEILGSRRESKFNS